MTSSSSSSSIEQSISFHRRILKAPGVAFSSSEGRKLFESSLRQGYLENYFKISEYFNTQSEPSFCGLGSLTMALNALNIDPERVWKGSWRWFDDSMLDCCVSLDIIKKEGIMISQLECLAKCNGADVIVHYAENSTEELFREYISNICSDKSVSSMMIVSYTRKVLNQTGDGHFSPISAYDPTTDMVLIMDVARFKYPPHWVPVSLLWNAMLHIDLSSNKSRGFMVLSKSKERSNCKEFNIECASVKCS